MKKYAILVLVLVLTAALFTGCGCTNQVEPSTNATIDNGNGPLDGMDDITENTAARQGTAGVR